MSSTNEHKTPNPDYQAYLKRELARGIEQLDRKEYSTSSVESIIVDQRRKLSQRHGLDNHRSLS